MMGRQKFLSSSLHQMTPALQLCTLLVVLVVSQGFRLRQGVQAGRGRLVVPRPASRLYSSAKLFEDDDEGEFRRVCENYLDNKYKDCKEGVEGSLECRFACDRTEIENILVTLLPPVTKTELKREVDLTMQRFKGMTTVDAKDFYDAVISNSFWEEAGPLVVKELIYLDSLYAFYRNKQMFLGDDEYNSLKDMLTWEGSSIVSMKGNEALFVTAVAAYLRGKPILGDEEYSKLKESLKSEQSWVVERKQDSLEKLGLNTFIGYLHRSL